MSHSTTNPNNWNERPTDGSAVFTHPDTPYLEKTLTYLDRLALHELVAGGKRFANLTEKEVVNFFV